MINLLKRQLFLLKYRFLPGVREFYERHPDLLVCKEFNYSVVDGPFRGMRYISESNGSVLIPKLIGTYEKELHPYINRLITGHYNNIVDIGCAEGYYAVGIALKLRDDKNAKVYAFDTNDNAIKNLKLLAAENQVSHKIETGHYCDADKLNSFENGNTIVICDIEGAEADLIDPELAPNILKYDFLIEIHDGGPISSTIKDRIRERFKDSHTIQVINYVGRNEEDFAKIRWIKDTDKKRVLIDEGRVYGLEWMFLQKK